MNFKKYILGILAILFLSVHSFAEKQVFLGEGKVLVRGTADFVEHVNNGFEIDISTNCVRALSKCGLSQVGTILAANDIIISENRENATTSEIEWYNQWDRFNFVAGSITGIGAMNVAARSARLTNVLLHEGTFTNHLMSFSLEGNGVWNKVRRLFSGVEVNGAGNLWKTFLDDAFTLSKRTEVIAEGLPARFPNLTIDELTAIKVYTSDQMRNGSKIYQTLNTELRAGNLSAYNAGLNDLVNNALSKLPSQNGNVFRGVYGAEANLAKTWKVGDDVPFKDFKSSSTNKQVAAYDFAEKYDSDVFYEIIGANGRSVCGISCVPNEMEVLLKSNLKFKVKEIQPNHMVFDKNFEFQKPFTRIVLEITQ